MSPYDGHQGSRVPPSLTDRYGRTVSYLRLSVTDRCDLRCTYCMAEHMVFLPKADLLSLEELDQVASAFIGLGVSNLRLTGGEPLVRKGVMELFTSLSRHLKSGALEDLTLTTNGTRLARHAEQLAGLGIRRVNVSLDSLDRDVFRRLTRGGDLDQVLEGLSAATAAGLKIKINTVALARDNADQLPDLIRWAHDQGYDITLIEAMPLGEIEENRTDQFLSLDQVKQQLRSFWTLVDLPDRTAGPARYVRLEETGGRLGFITPLTHNFCEGCNRVRVTCTGTLHTCLGQEDAVDLRTVLRSSPTEAGLISAIRDGIWSKPKGHDFRIGERLAVSRHMSRTGG